jgi:hypothetical protein
MAGCATTQPLLCARVDAFLYLGPPSLAVPLKAEILSPESKLKDDRQMRSEIHNLLAPIAVEFNFQERVWSILA